MKSLLAAIAVLIAVPVSANDIPTICDSSVEGLFNEYRLEDLEASEALFLQPAEVIAEEVLAHSSSFAIIPWRLQVPSRPNVLKAAYLVQLKLAQSMIDNFEPNVSARQILQRASQSKATYSPTALEHAQRVMEAVRKSDSNVGDSFNKIKENASLLCAPYFASGCPNALRETLKIMDPHSGGTPYIASTTAVTHPTSLNAILSDASLTQGLSYVALRLMDRVEKKRPLGKSLFDDLKESFQRFGSTPEVAEDQAWTVLTFYSTRGASIAHFEGAANPENLPVWVSLYVLSTAIGVIDADSAPTGRAYSYPQEISGYCKMDRPYHFWLAASLVRELVKRGNSPKSAAAAVHIAGKLYEFGAPVTGRDSFRVYKDQLMSAYPVMMRISVAYKTVGVLWAAGLYKQPLNFDNALSVLLKKAEPMPEGISASEIEAASALTRYRWFDRIIAPDSALKKFGPF